MSPIEKLFLFFNYNNIVIENKTIWKACEKELPNIMNNELSGRQHDCVTCLFIDGLNQKETAEKLGLAQPTVSRHVNSGAKKLLKRLSYVLNVAKTVADHYEQENQNNGNKAD